jgi:hypothetical protein
MVLFAHFRAVADAATRPVLLYNVPTRTACDLLPETVARLAEHPRIVGLKEGSPRRRVANARLRTLCGASFAILSGDDATALDLLLAGGDGVISVTANVAPREMHDMVALARAGDATGAHHVDARLRPVHEALFVESNPIPLKWRCRSSASFSPASACRSRRSASATTLRCDARSDSRTCNERSSQHARRALRADSPVHPRRARRMRRQQVLHKAKCVFEQLRRAASARAAGSLTAPGERHLRSAARAGDVGRAAVRPLSSEGRGPHDEGDAAIGHEACDHGARPRHAAGPDHGLPAAGADGRGLDSASASGRARRSAAATRAGCTSCRAVPGRHAIRGERVARE